MFEAVTLTLFAGHLNLHTIKNLNANMVTPKFHRRNSNGLLVIRNCLFFPFSVDPMTLTFDLRSFSVAQLWKAFSWAILWR